MEKGAVGKRIEQLVKVEQPTNLSLEPIEEQYFDINTNSPNIPVAVPTKAQSKCVMRCCEATFVPLHLVLQGDYA